MHDEAWIKLSILSRGLIIDESIGEYCARTEDVALRRNVYNTPIWTTGPAMPMPQEVRLGPVVLAVNSYGESDWRLAHDSHRGAPVLRHDPSGMECPASYLSDLSVLANGDISALANIYGGAALAFFSPRSCYFFNDGSQCGFCSLEGTADESRGYSALLSPDEITTAVNAALDNEPDRIEQIMIVGGNMRNLNRGFRHHVSLATAATRAIAAHGLADRVSVHVATMPPRDLALIADLKELDNVHVMFNLEVWDPVVFADLCPGKDADYGRDGILQALGHLRDAIGPYRAHSLLIAGLEPAESTVRGAFELAEMGVSPIVNVYHSDRHARLGLGQRPTFETLVDVALGIQELYRQYPVLPYWRSCGRNSIDSEASRQLFASPVPAFLGAAATA